MYGLDTYAGGFYGFDGAPSKPTSDAVDALVRETMGTAPGDVILDDVDRETLGHGLAVMHVDKVSRDVMGTGTGILHGDGVVREVVWNGTGFIHSDMVVREVLLAPKTGVFMGGLVREVLAKGPHAFYVTLEEAATLRDSMGGSHNYAITIHESAPLADQYRVVPGRCKKLIYDPLPQNHPDPTVRQIQAKVNRIQQGGVNTAFVEIVLDSNATSTTLVDSRIGPNSHVTLTPESASAAAETYWVECQQGRVIVHHTSSDDTTRKFGVNIVA